MSVSVAAGAPVLLSDGTLHFRLHPTPPLALGLPESS